MKDKDIGVVFVVCGIIAIIYCFGLYCGVLIGNSKSLIISEVPIKGEMTITRKITTDGEKSDTVYIYQKQ